MANEQLQGKTIGNEEIEARSLAAFEGLFTPQAIATMISEFVGNIMVNNNITAAQDFLAGVLNGFETLMRISPMVEQLILRYRYIEAQKSFYYQEGVLTAFAAMERLTEVGLAHNVDQARANLERMKIVLIGMKNRDSARAKA